MESVVCGEQYLLDLGVLDVDERDNGGTSVLGAASESGHTEVVRVLVEKGGVDLDVEGAEKDGPMYRACTYGHGKVVQVLAEAVHPRTKAGCLCGRRV